MSRSSNSLKTSDVITTPIKLKYTSSYDCNTIGAYGIQVLTGRNGPVTVTGSISEETLRYRSIRHLYYSNYLTGSYAVSASAADNFLQSTAASGTLDADLRYFPTESNAKITVISIPRNVYGQQVSRRGFILSSSLYRIVDDGNGNLFDIIQTDIPPYVNNLYYAPIITDWYVYENVENIFHVGNIIYPQGMVIITNPEYQEVFNPDGPTADPDTATFATTDSPKTLNILSNDDPGSGVLNPLSVVLSGGDVALFTNNYNSTVTLNTNTPGTYTTNYTVESEIGDGCSLESNETTITVYVIAPTTTSTTTTTTTTPTLSFFLGAGCTPAGAGVASAKNYAGAPSGLYEISTTTYSSQAAALAGTFVASTTRKVYYSVPNGTRWVALRDAVTPSIVTTRSVSVSCTPATTTTTVPPATTTTTTTTGTTTTTTTVPGQTTTTTTTVPTTTTTSTTTTTTTLARFVAIGTTGCYTTRCTNGSGGSVLPCTVKWDLSKILQPGDTISINPVGSNQGASYGGTFFLEGSGVSTVLVVNYTSSTNNMSVQLQIKDSGGNVVYSMTPFQPIPPQQNTWGFPQCTCKSFTGWAKQSGEGTLSYNSQLVRINALEGDTAQDTYAQGTFTVAPGCENTVATFQINIGTYSNQTGSLRAWITGNQGQGSLTEVNFTQTGLGTQQDMRTFSQTGSYTITLEGAFGSNGGNVSSNSYVRIT